jgi:hypothetical protein
MLNNERWFLEQASWKALFQSLIVTDSRFSARSEIALSLLHLRQTVEYEKRSKVTSTYVSCVMVSTRLLAAVSTTTTGRGLLEEQTQRFADQTLEIERNIAPISP